MENNESVLISRLKFWNEYNLRKIIEGCSLEKMEFALLETMLELESNISDILDVR